ncbi:MAG TPA: RNA polymerase sigma factor [Terriglobia bacterium]|nr:RNA polymerase sigma factor [Terriglobia bacterium]
MNDSLGSLATDVRLEHDLIAGAQAGNESAFAALFEKHKRVVYSLSLRILRVPADAEDVTQDVFLLLFRKISMFRGESAFSTWLYRLATNVALSRLRRSDMKNRSWETEDSRAGRASEVRAGAPDPRLRHCVDRLTLEQAISGLPSNYQSVFALYVVHGYKHREIAKMLNCSISNSKSQLHKARQVLRAKLRSQASKRTVLRAGRRPLQQNALQVA